MSVGCFLQRCPSKKAAHGDGQSTGAAMSAIGRVPIHGKTSRSNRRRFFSPCDAAHDGANSTREATASKLLADRSVLAFLTAFRCSPGSIPMASNCRDWSHRRELPRFVDPVSYPCVPPRNGPADAKRDALLLAVEPILEAQQRSFGLRWNKKWPNFIRFFGPMPELVGTHRSIPARRLTP